MAYTLDKFERQFLKRDGDIKDRAIQQWHLATDFYASGVFASGIFDYIKIDGPTSSGYILTADSDGWGTWQASALISEHNVLSNLKWSEAGHTIDTNIVPTASGTQSVGTQAIAFDEINAKTCRLDDLYITDIYIGSASGISDIINFVDKNDQSHEVIIKSGLIMAWNIL